MMRSSLHQRIAALIVLATIAVVSVTVTLNYQSTRQALLAEVQDSFIDGLQARVLVAADAVERLRDPAELQQVREIIGGDTVVEALGGASWASSRPDEVPVELRERAQTGSPGTYFQRAEIDGRPQLVVALAVGYGPDPPGFSDRVVVYGFRDLSAQQRQLTALVRTAIAITVPAVLVVGLLGYLASRRLTRPLRTLDRAARGLSHGEFTTVPPPRSTDEVAHLTASFNDAARQLEVLVADLRHREAQSRQFAEDVAHELRTPLAAMMAVVEVLEGAIADNDQSPVALATRTTANQTRRLADLVADLLEVSRPDDSDAKNLVTERVDLGNLVAEILTARDMRDRVKVKMPADPVWVVVDKRRMDVIVANLVTNAFEHGLPPVVVTVAQDGDKAVVRVRDHGPGVAAGDEERIFDRFVKADASRGRTVGSGLGLSIVERNARLLSGRVALQSISGQGAEFAVELNAVTVHIVEMET